MIMLAYLLLMGIVLGIGLLLASILPSRGARIGLGGALGLALVVDSTWIAAPLIGWSARLGDLVWIGVVLFAALAGWSAALSAEGRPDAPTWKWLSWRDLLFLGMVIALVGAVLLVLPVPLDTDAQGFGYLALTLRDGGDYMTLAPWHPEIEYLYSPAFPGLVAHLSARFDLGIHHIQLILGGLSVVLFVWLAYDLGCEVDDRRGGRAYMLAAVLSVGAITAFMDSHFTAMLALIFGLAFLVFVIRFLRTGRWSNALAAAICLAAVPLSQPDTTIAFIIGYGPWLILIWLSRPRPPFVVWLGLAAVIPLVALGLLAPWLISLEELLGSGIESPFVVDSAHWRTMIGMHGGLIVLLALPGLIIGLRRRRPIDLWMIIWLVAIVEFSTLGLLEKALPDMMAPLLKYDYPFSLAWHGPIIPYMVLGGTALLWFADRWGGERLDRWIGRLVPVLVVLAVGGGAAGVWKVDSILDVSKDYVDFYGAFSSQADVEAMTWLRDFAPEDALILNHPGPHEGDWVPVISERNTVYFRPQPFFRGTGEAEALQESLRAFWRDPADPENYDLLAAAGVRYVIVPQIFGDPASFDSMMRWRRPVPESESYLQTPVSEAPYLALIFERDGAQVYEVVGPREQ